jgi:hypothetical protein
MPKLIVKRKGGQGSGHHGHGGLEGTHGGSKPSGTTKKPGKLKKYTYNVYIITNDGKMHRRKVSAVNVGNAMYLAKSKVKNFKRFVEVHNLDTDEHTYIPRK